MPSRGNNGYIGGIDGSDTANSAKAVFSSRDYGYCVATGDLDVPAAYDRDYTGSDYVRPSSGGGSGATATVSLKNGSVTSFRVTNVGSNYTSDPTVTFTGGGGTGAEAYVVRSANTVNEIRPYFQVYGLDIVYGGEGYTSAPTITISAPQGAGGTTATVTSTTITNGVLTGITFGTTGTRYTGLPGTITISTSGSTYPAQVVARIRCGSGYTSAPAIGFSGGGGTNAAAVSYIAAELDTVTITNGGSGYTSAPTVYIPGMNLSATATATLSGSAVNAISISGCTNKFYEPPAIRIGGWPALPSVSNGDQKFVGAFAVYNHSSNFVAFTCQGNYTVDWGDGTTNNYNSNVTAYKQYTATEYAAISGQSVYKNYKVVIITITPQAGANLTSINLDVKHNQSGLATYRGQWLDIKVAGQNLTSLKLAGSAVINTMLEQFEFVGTASASWTDWTGMFNNCYSLDNIVSLPGSTPTNLTSTFSNTALQYIPDFNTSGITTLASTFLGCRRLRRIPVITSTSITTLSDAFRDCNSIVDIPITITSSCTSLASAFSGCYKLLKIPKIDATNVTNISNAFYFCMSITEAPDMDLRKCTTTSSMFGYCPRLTSVGYLATFAATSMTNMFQNCVSLASIRFLSTAKAGSLNSIFWNCWSLKSLPTIDLSSTSGINYGFASNYSLSTISLVNSTPLLTDVAQSFYGPNMLREIPWFDMSRATSASLLYNSNFVLKNVPQHNYTACTGAPQTFGNCYNLRELPKIDFPKVTDAGTLFNGCAGINHIESMTLGSLTGSTNMFSGASSLPALPVIDLSTVTAAMSNFATNTNIKSGYTTGMRYGHSYQNCMLAAAELNTIYTNLGTAVGAQTITVTGNWGTTGDDTTIATNKGWTVSG